MTRPGGATEITEKYPDGQIKSVTGSGVIAKSYDYGTGGDGTRWTCVYTGPSGTSSPVQQKTSTDAFGRVVRIEKPAFGGGTVTTVNTYNSKDNWLLRKLGRCRRCSTSMTISAM